MAYPTIMIIKKVEHKGRRDSGKIMIPYSQTPDLKIGDDIIEKSGNYRNSFEVIDLNFMPGGTLGVGTKYPDLLTATVESRKDQKVKKNDSSVYNIGTIQCNANIGNDNSQIININIQELVTNIAKSDDQEAKSLIVKLLENSTVASLIGPGMNGLFKLFQ